jgi:molybdopterin molybdotransferase
MAAGRAEARGAAAHHGIFPEDAEKITAACNLFHGLNETLIKCLARRGVSLYNRIRMYDRVKSGLSINDALRVIRKNTRVLGREAVRLDKASGRVLAAGVKSPCDVPAFDNSAMDGYAVRAADLRGASRSSPATLKLAGDAPIGKPFKGVLKRGAAIRVATGSMIPAGADTIVRKEYAAESSGVVRVFRKIPRGTDCRRRGEDIRAGRTVLEKGKKLDGHAIALLASSGIVYVKAGKRPAVAIIATGNELVEPGVEPRLGEVRASSVPAIAAECAGAGAVVTASMLVKDDVRAMSAAIRKVSLTADAIITTGGVSVGRSDLVKEAVVAAGGKIIFQRVKVKPGSPLSFGKINGKPVFMLPGNPAAALLDFEFFVRPALLMMQGAAASDRLEITAVLAEGIKKQPSSAHFIRCGMDYSGVKPVCTPLKEQGSGIVSSLAAADAVFVLPENTPKASKGRLVKARLLSSRA